MLIWNKTKNIFYFYGKEITEADYNHIKAIIDSRPAAPDGYGYRLTESLEWELYELPPAEEEEEVTAEDYEAALAEMGVTL
jgi:hypothetical protein